MAILTVCLFVGWHAAFPAEQPRVAVIIHPSRSVAFSNEDLRRIYLKQQRTWTDGSPIAPVNQVATSPVRRAFERRILHLGEERLAAYWNERYFEGVFPPITFSSDLAVRRYVADDPNAIGYLDASSVDGSVRIARILE